MLDFNKIKIPQILPAVIIANASILDAASKFCSTIWYTQIKGAYSFILQPWMTWVFSMRLLERHFSWSVIEINWTEYKVYSGKYWDSILMKTKVKENKYYVFDSEKLFFGKLISWPSKSSALELHSMKYEILKDTVNKKDIKINYNTENYSMVVRLNGYPHFIFNVEWKYYAFTWDWFCGINYDMYSDNGLYRMRNQEWKMFYLVDSDLTYTKWTQSKITILKDLFLDLDKGWILERYPDTNKLFIFKDILDDKMIKINKTNDINDRTLLINGTELEDYILSTIRESNIDTTNIINQSITEYDILWRDTPTTANQESNSDSVTDIVQPTLETANWSRRRATSVY